MRADTESPRIDLTREAPFTLGAVQVTPATREIALGDRREVLEPRIMQVLTALARRRGEIVTRDELIASCWENRAVGNDAINRSISRLRRLSESFGGFALETVSRVGYRLTAVASPETAPAAEEQPHKPLLRRWYLWATIGLVIFVIGAVVYKPRQAATPLPVRQVIAVLPFDPQSADRSTQLFGDRVASAVAETLSKMGQPVVPTAESFQYRGAAKARAARELSAMYVIDGEVVREAGKVRVSVHLNDTLHGTTVFAHTLEESIDRADALPDRVAGYIAGITWGSDITQWNKRNAAILLRALDQQQRGDYFTAYETAKALVVSDPDDAGSQNLLAWAAVNVMSANPSLPKADLVAQARRAAEKTIRLQPDEGGAYAVLASITPPFQWAERESDLRRALSISPGSVGLSMYLTWFLNEAGRFREADVSARSAFERFPVHARASQVLVEQQLGMGQVAAAREHLPKARRLWPDNLMFADLGFEAAAFQNSPSEAEAFLRDPEAMRNVTVSRKLIWTKIAGALNGRRAGTIASLARDCAKANDAWWGCLVSSAKLGRLDQAFAIAAVAYPDQRAATPEAIKKKWFDGGNMSPTRYLFIPATAALRADPRFIDLAERTGLLQYWKSTRRPPDFCATERAPVCRLLK